MLRRRGEIYWFRRKVPLALMEILRTREFSCSLRTGSRKEAEARSRAVWLRTEQVFTMASSSVEREQSLVLLRRMASQVPWAETELGDVMNRAIAGDERDVRSILLTTKDDILAMSVDEQVRVVLHLRMLLEMLEQHDIRNSMPYSEARHRLLRRETENLELFAMLAKQAQEKPSATQATLPDFVDLFIIEKSRTTREHDGYTPNTAHQVRTTFRLWTELMGDLPLSKVGGKEAGKFRDQLLRMPASHGKSGGKGPSKSAPMPALQAIEQADRRDAAAQAAGKVATGLVPRLSMKTTKRHFSAMQQLWKYLRQRDVVTSNPFAGFSFPGTGASKSVRDDWSEDDLLKLLRSEHMRRVAAARDRDFWIVSIAMYTGMRLEEVCRLRPGKDVTSMDGFPFFLVQDQADPPWSPKTEAGERAVAIHPVLIEAGIHDWSASRQNADRLVPGTRHTGRDGKLGTEFSREFSKLKGKLGVASKTTFHSFRHNVSTILRNEGAHVRGEWIDAVLGHEGAEGQSMGVTVYMKRIGAENLHATVECIRYPDAVQTAFRDLCGLV